MNNFLLKSNNIAFKTTQQYQTSGVQPSPEVKLPIPDVQLPDLYHTPKNKTNKDFKETLKKWDIMNLVYPWLAYPFLMLGTCGALSYGVDKFSEACGGEYNKSLVGRAANLGDKITNSGFVKSKPMQTLLSWGESIKNSIGKIFKKSDVIQAIKNTPSKPEWAMVKDELLSMEQRIVRDFTDITKGLKLTEDGAVELNRLNIGKKEKEFLKNFFGDAKIADEVKSNALQLKNLGFEDDAIRHIINSGNATETVKKESLKKLGLTVDKVGMELKDYFEKLAKGQVSQDDIKIIREACDKARGISVSEGYKSWLGPLQIFKRKVSVDEVANRLVSMDKGKTSKLGRMFSTLIQKCHRGFTFGGSKATVLFFVTPFLVDSLIDVKKADKNEKVGTAAHGLVHSVSWVFTFPLALKIMHHLGGAQYAGMSADKVAEYRNLIKEFNKKVKNGAFDSYDKYLNGEGGLKELKTKLNALKVNKGQNLLTKISKKLGSFLTMDLENIAAYKGPNTLMNVVRKIPSFFRNLGGIPMRFAIWAGISMGVLDTIINKGLKGLFGNHYDRFKEEDKIARKEEQKAYTKEDLQARLLDLQRQKTEGTVADGSTEKSIITPLNETKITPTPTDTNASSTESIIPQESPKYNDIPTQKKSVEENVREKIDNYTYIPSSENVIKTNKPETEANKYIPSQTAANINKSYDNSGLNAALKRADRAEKLALQTLAGNFNRF